MFGKQKNDNLNPEKKGKKKGCGRHVAATALTLPAIATIGTITGLITQKDRYSFESPQIPVNVGLNTKLKPQFETIYVGGVESTKDKFQKHLDTLAVNEISPALPKSNFIGFRNHSFEKFSKLDWAEVISLYYPLEWVGIDDPVTGSMTDALAKRIKDSKAQYVILIGHSEGAQFAKVAAEKICHQDPSQAKRIGILYIEPFLVGMPDNRTITVGRTAKVSGHRLDNYLAAKGTIRQGIEELKEQLEEH